MEKDFILEPRKKRDYTPDPKIIYDVVIVGGGVAGFSAAMYAKRLGMEVLILGDTFGGTIMLADIVENWPGIVSTTGQKLAKLIENHAKDYDIDIFRGLARKIEKKKDFFNVLTKEEVFKSRTLIFATGTRLKRLGVKGEGEFSGRGVSYCALCDGRLYKDKIVGIVGGSDSAIKEALFLAEHAKKVFVIYRGEKVHPEKVILQRLNKRVKEGKIEVINNTNVLEIKGDKFVNSVLLDKEFNRKDELDIEGLFIYVGREPLSDLAKELGVSLNQKGEIKTNRMSETNIDGIYASGDVSDFEFKQAITSSAQGVTAAYSAYKYLESK